MKFKFNLEKLLQYRKQVEDLAKKDYFIALAELEDQKKILSEYFDQISKTRSHSHNLELKGGTQVESLVQGHFFIKGTEIRIEAQRKIIDQHQKTVEEKLEILKQASIESKMIERIKENKKEEFLKLKKKNEQKFADEMTTLRFKGEKAK